MIYDGDARFPSVMATIRSTWWHHGIGNAEGEIVLDPGIQRPICERPLGQFGNDDKPETFDGSHSRS